MSDLICDKKERGYECIYWDKKRGEFQRFEDIESIEIRTNRLYTIMARKESGFYSESVRGRPRTITTYDYEHIYISGDFGCEPKGRILVCR